MTRENVLIIEDDPGLADLAHEIGAEGAILLRGEDCAGRIAEMRAADVVGERAVVASVAEAQAANTQNTIEIGRAMFGSYVVVVQLAGLLLLIAMVGAIAIARKRVPIEETGPPPPPPPRPSDGTSEPPEPTGGSAAPPPGYPSGRAAGRGPECADRRRGERTVSQPEPGGFDRLRQQ